MQQLKYIVKKNINYKDQNNGATPLGYSIQSGVETTSYLLEKGADPIIVFSNGLTALHACCGLKNPDAVCKELIKAGVHVDVQSADKVTPLHVAAIYGNVAFAKFLIDNGADTKAKTKGGFTPLHYCLTPMQSIDKSVIVDLLFLQKKNF